MPLMKIWSKTEKTYITKHVNVDPRSVTLFLENHSEPTSIFCIYCKNKLFDVQHRVVQINPGDPPEEANYLKVLCSNPGCKTFYWLVGVA